MTVKELREAIARMPDDAEVRIASSPDDEIIILSVYQAVENPALVWIDVDIGEQE